MMVFFRRSEDEKVKEHDVLCFNPVRGYREQGTNFSCTIIVKKCIPPPVATATCMHDLIFNLNLTSNVLQSFPYWEGSTEFFGNRSRYRIVLHFSG